MPIRKRAYSDEEKQQREQKIIDAAESLLGEKSYFAINMSEVARTAEVAKGTLYLYFQTKEELFLALFERKMNSWFATMMDKLEALETPASNMDIVDIIEQGVVNERQLIRLMALTNIIFEHNITYETARDYKLWLYESAVALGDILESRLNLQQGHGAHIVFRIYVIVIGLENLANPAPIIHEVYARQEAPRDLDFETELRALLMMLFETL